MGDSDAPSPAGRRLCRVAQCPLWVISGHVQCTSHVRFTPNSDRESGFTQKVMSALPPKADMCGALAHVRFVPIADINDMSGAAATAGVRGVALSGVLQR